MLLKILLYTILLFICVNNNDLSAQILEGHLASQKIKNAQKIWLNEKNSSIKYIEFLVPEKIEEKNHSKWLCQLLDCPSNVEFRLIRKIDDQIGQTHYRYAQYMDGYLIEGAQYLVHKRNNQILSVNGDLHTAKELVSSASISEAEALSYAQKAVPSNNYLWEAEKAAPPEGSLVLVGKKGIYRLTYKFDIYSLNPLGRYYIFVDANSGEIIQKISRIHNVATPGIAHTKYSGIQTIITDSIGPGMYILKDSTRNIHTRDLNTSTILSTAVEFTDSNNVWTSTINQDDAALDAHWGTAMTYDYFLNMHGLDSYDGLGSSLNSYVHYGANVYNAFWDGSQMLYGDGDGVRSTALTSIDIVGHEISHGVTEYSANLVYQDEPGALNESFSDIFGVAIDFYANPTTANWYMGDQISLPDNGERNLADPNEMQHPDTYQGTYWHIGAWDYGGVHTNSGVQNFWFYLLAEGGTGVNDIGDAYTITGLGAIDAAKIAYRNLSVYLIPSSQYVDARFYAIQSASDLFGACSIEEEETTNAWHAVGIGNLHPNSVRVSFNVSQMYSCSIPVTIDFNNTSINDSTTLWYFGDGDSSSLRNSSHTYTAAGIYDLTLIIAGSSSCGRGADTIFLPNYIRIDSSGGPIAAACTPVATTGDLYYGIFNYTFNTINNSTGGSLDGYEDYSCSHQTRVTEGDFVNLSIETGPHYNENVAVYIDYNNDGIFRATERIYAHSGIHYHTATVRIATATAHNVPLRMRVISDARALTSTCNGSLNRSQIEDYNIIIAPALTPPVANFAVNPATTINLGNSVSFSDNSSGFPHSYLWSFPNGVPSTSTIANPVVTYSTLGRHDVQLIVTNTFGSDTLLRSNYISVIDTAIMCSSSSSIGRSGFLYDSGGRLGDYSNDEDCYFLIEPLCVDSIILDFTAFNTQACCDFIRVYDGTSTAGTLLYNARGNTLPPRAIATSGAMYIYFHSSIGTNSSGFEAHWSTVQSLLPPVVASFTASNLNPVFGSSVSFTDQTANNPSSWLWEFGDGNTSIAQNPTHTYLSSGPHTVNLITSICGIFDTSSQIINVQAPPMMETNPDSVSVTMNCGDSMTVPIVISNTGNGPLYYTINSTHSLLPIDVVAWTYGVDYGAEYTNTINGLNNYYSNYTLRETNTTDPTTLQSFLSTAHVLLIPEQEMASFFVLQGMAPILQNYVNNGGWIIVCGNQASSIHALGLFNLTAGNSVFTGVQTIVDTSSPLLVNTTAPIRNLNSTFYGTFSNIGFNTVTSYLGSSVIGDLDIGQGKAIYIGFDYSQNTPNRDQIIANAVEWAATNTTPLWMTNSPDSGSVLAGDSVLVDAIINVNGIAGGIYNGNLVIESNDSINPILNIPINLTIAGTPSIAFNENCVLFDSTIQHTSDTAGIWVYNRGCDTLRIMNITSSNANVSPNSSNLVLNPYDSAYVNFIFTPNTAQSYLGSITFFSNAGDSIICLDGTGILPPMIEINPDSIFVTINCEDSVVVPLIISNIGMSVLTYNDTIVDTWLALSSNSGVIPLGGSNTDDVTIYGAGRTDGVYTSNIYVYSNDPNTPTQIIPVILTIERNAILGVSDSCLNLGSIFQNISTVDSVLVSNTGCEAMYITNVVSNSSGLIGTIDTLIIPSGESTWLEVSYTSNVLGTFNTTITIVTANQDTSICVYGIVTIGSDVKQLETSEVIAKIYPNPNNGDFTFYYKGDSKSIHLNLYGVNGQLILNKEHQVRESLVVNFTDLNLSEGVYYLEMISDKEIKTLELIVTEP